MTNKTGLLCSIYDNAPNCSNGGISARVRSVVCLDIPGPFAPSADAPAVRLVRRTIFGHPYIHAEPVDQPAPGSAAGPMAGGAFIYSCDSRFRRVNAYPIPLHDRFEGWELYESMSH